MIKVTLKGDVVKEYEAGISVADAAKDISMGLYRAATCAKVNGKLADLRTPLDADCSLEILTFEDEEGKKTDEAGQVLIFPDEKRIEKFVEIMGD